MFTAIRYNFYYFQTIKILRQIEILLIKSWHGFYSLSGCGEAFYAFTRKFFGEKPNYLLSRRSARSRTL